ncbi:hypothetical protein [Pseudoruegeria sp. HB172150]|nr:hypothetical protein [Pseudoruegeria sp. HB172150]
MKKTGKIILCPRGVSIAFVAVSIAAAFGAPTTPVMLTSAGLYALLAWIG